MEKIKLGVICGGMSTENEVSVVSASYVLSNLNKEKYEIYPVYIDKKGQWWEILDEFKPRKFGEEITKKEKIENEFKYLKNLNVIFPVLHGLYGEDGTIQGLFELLQIPYVGCHVLASSVGMDKVYAKVVFEKAEINQVKSIYVRKYNDKYVYIDEHFNEEILSDIGVAKKVQTKIDFPMFVKPSNSGSSVGVKKAENESELVEAINYAAQFDKKVLIEQGIIGREVECAVLGNEDVIASSVGEIKAADEFYSYDAKYNNQESRTEIPADLPKDIIEEIRKQAVKAFKAIDGSGLSRVDFFVENGTNKIYLNEINTLPGFTSISMYPKLFEQAGIKYEDLLDKLIELAVMEK